MSGPVHVTQPLMQDLCYEAREAVKDFHRTWISLRDVVDAPTWLAIRDQIEGMHNALNRERSYRHDGKPFDGTEVREALATGARALWAMSRKIDAAMEKSK